MKYKIIKTKDYNELQRRIDNAVRNYSEESLRFSCFREAQEELKKEWKLIIKGQKEEVKKYKKDVNNELDTYKSEYEKEEEKMRALFLRAIESFNHASSQNSKFQELCNQAITELKQITNDGKKVKNKLTEVVDSFEDVQKTRTRDLIDYYKAKNELQQKDYDDMYFKQHELSYAQHKNYQLQKEIEVLKNK